MMDPTTETTQETKFIYRRLEESLRLGGKEYDPEVVWISVLVGVLAVAFVYVVWMYRRDSRTVGWKWAVFLGTLRCSVYALLAWVFLLPANQKWEKLEQRSKVLVGADVSRSMSTPDDLPTEGVPFAKLPTRLDKLAGFFADGQFLAGLHRLNPTTFYRFGSILDDQGWPIGSGEELSPEMFASWLHLKDPLPENPTEEQLAEAKKIQERYQRMLSGTNYGDALLRIANREHNNLVQALIVFGDGRNTQGSDQALRDLRNRTKGKVPIITVAVGEHRPPVNILITDLQTPEQARPDDKFPVRVEVDGPGLPETPTTVTLEIISPSGKKFPEKRDFKFDQGAGGPPHAQIEFEIDAAKHGIAVDGKKPELEEGQWKFVARIPRDKRERFPDPEHVSPEQTVTVIKKPLRVLLFADAATRDFQFVRNLFVREVDQRRAELSVCLQTQRPGVVQDVPADQLLRHFPTRLGGDGQEKPEERFYNLSRYDLIIAFDPDWTQLTPEQLNLLEQWVRLHAGGLVLVAGPIHTTKMARPGPIREQLRQLLDLYPVYLKDSTLLGLGAGERARSTPHRLLFSNVTPDIEFLKLDDEGKDPLSGWEEFFTGRAKVEGGDAKVERGFYSYYPARSVKPSAVVLASFGDPRADLLEDGKPQPWLATMSYGGGKVVYLSSGETYRLRTHREEFHERFWTKLGRYAGSGTLSRLSRHGVLVMGREFTAGQMVRLEAQLFGRDMQPLATNSIPRLELKPPAGVTMATTYTLKPKPSAGSEWNGWFQAAFRVTQPGEYRLDLHLPETGDILPGKFTVKETDPELDNTQPDFNFLYQLASPVSEVDGRLDADEQRQLEDTLRANAARLVGLDDSTGADGKSREAVRLFFDLTSAHLIPTFMSSDSRTQRNKGQMEDLWDDGWIITKEELELFVKNTRLALLMVGLGLLLALGGAWLFDKPLRKWLLAAGIIFLVQLPLYVVTQLPREWVLPSGITPQGNLVAIAGPDDQRVLILSFVLLLAVALLSLEWMTRKLLRLA